MSFLVNGDFKTRRKVEKKRKNPESFCVWGVRLSKISFEDNNELEIKQRLSNPEIKSIMQSQHKTEMCQPERLSRAMTKQQQKIYLRISRLANKFLSFICS